ncbi:hypothetical protein C8039_12425 [Halogeometricum sp. wsp3]|nr:hypothetical protein C8039_12425 [Halogeometricum sp. wsp3]
MGSRHVDCRRDGVQVAAIADRNVLRSDTQHVRPALDVAEGTGASAREVIGSVVVRAVTVRRR